MRIEALSDVETALRLIDDLQGDPSIFAQDGFPQQFIKPATNQPTCP
jgi:hypothetical protein